MNPRTLLIIGAAAVGGFLVLRTMRSVTPSTVAASAAGRSLSASQSVRFDPNIGPASNMRRGMPGQTGP